MPEHNWYGDGSPMHGWLRVALLWILNAVDHLFSLTTLSAIATITVIVLTVLQIMVTWRRLKKPIKPAEQSNTL